MGKRENDITEAINRAVECSAMASILEKRIICIDGISKKLAFMGAILPPSLGTATFKLGEFGELDELGKLLAIAADSPIKTAAIAAVIILGAIQTIISIYSLTHKWNDNLPIYINSKIENHKNAKKYHDIWKKYDENEEEFARQLEETNASSEMQEEQDLKINLKEKEKRYGLRHALCQYSIACVHCGKIPDPKKPSNCSVCGK
jgi:mobilome CxxCx(11)CxxC protein